MPLIYPVGFLAAGVTLTHSITLAAASSQFLNRTFGTATNVSIYTMAFWAKRTSIGGTGMVIFGPTATAKWYCTFGGSSWNGGSANSFGCENDSFTSAVTSSQQITDTTTWHHYVVAVDFTQATAASRVRIYIDGTEITYGTSSYPAQSFDPGFNDAASQKIGTYAGAASAFLDAKVADVYFIDGQQKTPSSFVTGTGSGTTHPAAYSGTYGVNGFHLSFSASDATDSSGNGNNWTQNGTPTFSTDVPT